MKTPAQLDAERQRHFSRTAALTAASRIMAHNTHGSADETTLKLADLFYAWMQQDNAADLVQGGDA